MFVFDIDDTISPTRPPEDWDVEFEQQRAFGFQVKIPTYVLDFMRDTNHEIALLSTWMDGAKHLAEAFNIDATILILDEKNGQRGISGKFDVVSNLDGVKGWADDHIKPAMKKALEAKGVTVIKPTKGVISPAQIKKFRNVA